MSQLSSSLLATFRTLGQQARAEGRKPNSVDALRSLLKQPQTGAGKLLSGIEAELPNPESDQGPGAFTETLRKSVELAVILAVDSPRCGTEHLLLALSRQPGPVADWLLLHASLSPLHEDPPEPIPPVASLWLPRLRWLPYIILYLLLSVFLGPACSLIALMLVPNLVSSLAKVGAYPVDREKCPRCARSDELKAMFDHQTGLCRPCSRHLERLPGHRYLAMLAGLALASAISYSQAVPLGPWLSNLGLLLLLQIAATLIHELGHALAGVLVGRRLLSFHLGRGSLHARTRLGRLWLYFQLPRLPRFKL